MMDTAITTKPKQQLPQECTDEVNGLAYTLVGDCYLPNLLPPESSEYLPGIWAQKRLRYLKQHRRAAYSNLLYSGALGAHLREIDERAEDWIWRLPSEMAKREGITEDLKRTDQMAWVQAMNNIYARVRELIDRDIIFA